MHYALVVLTATWMAGTPVDATPDAKAQTPPALQGTTNAAPADPTPPPKPSFGARVRNFFLPARPEHAERPEVPVLEPREVHTAAKLGIATPVTAAIAVKPAVTPAAATVQPAKTNVVPATTTITAMRPNLDLAENELKMVGHEADYSWITGKLSRASGRWVIHYSGPYEQDQYGGSILLTGSTELATFHEGDLVCVHGKVAPTSRLGHAAGASYEVQSINLLGHPTR